MEKLLSRSPGFLSLKVTDCLLNSFFVVPSYYQGLLQRSSRGLDTKKSVFCSQFNHSLLNDLGQLIYFNFKGTREGKINHCAAHR